MKKGFIAAAFVCALAFAATAQAAGDSRDLNVEKSVIENSGNVPGTVMKAKPLAAREDRRYQDYGEDEAYRRGYRDGRRDYYGRDYDDDWRDRRYDRDRDRYWRGGWHHGGGWHRGWRHGRGHGCYY